VPYNSVEVLATRSVQQTEGESYSVVLNALIIRTIVRERLVGIQALLLLLLVLEGGSCQGHRGEEGRLGLVRASEQSMIKRDAGAMVSGKGRGL
jgi:hypothetical protein